jgi:LysR family transcriptional activator of nhaA
MAALNFHHLKYFHAVARTGNLTQAATALHVSPSAVSVQIKALEDQLGHALFERRGRGLVLTEAGRLVLDRADAIFKAGDDLVATLRGRTPERGVVRIGAIATLSRNFQMAFLAPLLATHDADLILRSGSLGDLLGDLEAHRLDVVLANTAPPKDRHTGWVAHAIADQPVALIAAATWQRKRWPLDRLLREAPFLVPSLQSSIRTGFDAWLHRLEIVPHIVAEVDDMAMLRLLARENLGVAVVPPIVVREELAAGVLRQLHDLPQLKEHFYAITLSRKFTNPLLRQLVQAATLER